MIRRGHNQRCKSNLSHPKVMTQEFTKTDKSYIQKQQVNMIRVGHNFRCKSDLCREKEVTQEFRKTDKSYIQKQRVNMTRRVDQYDQTYRFLSNTSPDPLKILKPAFNVGPSSDPQPTAISRCFACGLMMAALVVFGSSSLFN